MGGSGLYLSVCSVVAAVWSPDQPQLVKDCIFLKKGSALIHLLVLSLYILFEMSDNESIIKIFVSNFVLKDKRERSYFELINFTKRNKFTDRLNHNWDSVLNMKFLTKISKDLDSAEAIQKLLNFKDEDMCYVISNYDEFDDQLIPFNEIFHKIYRRGLASILINTSANILFLDTEQVQGSANRFIGKLKSYF
jgi:hypothetical protein